MHLDEILAETAQRVPQRVAVTCGERQFTYAQLDAEVSRVASGFRNLGLVPGDRLAYQLRNECAEAIVTLFAALRAGLVVVPLAVRQAPLQIAYVLGHSATRAFVTERTFLERLSPEQRAGPEWIITVGDTLDGTVRFDALPCEPPRALSLGLSADDAIGLIVYTSGTTSRPKGVAHTQRRLSYRVDLFVEELDLTEGDATVVASEIGRPIILMGQVLPMFRTGGQVSLVNADPDPFWEAYRAQGRTSYVITASGMAPALLGHPAARAVSHASLRYWICGGDRVLPIAHQLAGEVLGRPLHEMLGMTEVGFFAIAPLDAEIRPGSVGQVMQGCQVRIVDDLGSEVPQGSVGELLVRTPNTMFGYWNDTIGTFRTFSDLWIRSGDLGRFDADGYLWIEGRAKLMISRGGLKVAPAMVEDALRAHPAVLDAVVVAQSHPLQNQVPFAFYLLREGAVDPGEPTLRQWLQPRLDTASIPDGFARLDR
ncbi:MAG TPA: class I adenylate-forming enzyme family protein, partial [Vicinamibacterales bacterium]